MQSQRTIHLSEKLHFAYLDSGQPSNSPYHTIICFHGLIYNSYGFTKMFDLARRANVRLLCPNRLGYKGSSPRPKGVIKTYQDVETFQIARTQEIALLINALIGKYSLTSCSILGWSLGCAVISNLLAFASHLPLEQRASLEKHVKCFVFLDGSVNPFWKRPPGGYNPVYTSPNLTEKQKHELYPVWLGSYYHHPDPTKLDGLEERQPLESKQASIYNMTSEERNAMEDSPQSEEIALSNLFRSTGFSDRHAQRTFTSSYFANAHLHWIWADESIWDTVVVRTIFDEEAEKSKNEGKPYRPVSLHQLRGANHFLNWDDAPGTLDLLLQIIN